MNDYQEIWKCLIENVLSKNYDKASEIWEPKTRKVFLKNIKKFRKFLLLEKGRVCRDDK